MRNFFFAPAFSRLSRLPVPSSSWRTIALTACLVFGSAACVSTQDGEQMKTDIEALKAQQDTMQQTISERETVMAEMIAQARKENELLRASIAEAQDTLRKNNAAQGIDLQKMRDELNQLRGTAEEIDFRLAKMEQDINLFKEDVELRLEGSTSSISLPEDASELFKLGQQALKDGKTREARKICEAFIGRHAEDSRVDQAIFCVGESYFEEGQYVSAIYEYQKIIKNHYDTSKRVPDAALRIGQSFKKLDKCPSSKPFFELIVSDYKRTSAAKIAQEELAKGCAK